MQEYDIGLRKYASSRPLSRTEAADLFRSRFHAVMTTVAQNRLRIDLASASSSRAAAAPKDNTTKRPRDAEQQDWEQRAPPRDPKGEGKGKGGKGKFKGGKGKP
jgi:hypothetical protein